MKCLSSGVECIQAAFSRKAATDYVGVSVNLFLPPLIMTVPQVRAIWVGDDAAGGFDPIVECVFWFRPPLVMVRNPAA